MVLKYGRKYRPSTTLDELSLSYSKRLIDLLSGSIYTQIEHSFFASAKISHGLMFAGKIGTGKRTLIDGFAGSAQICGYDLWEISVSELLGDNTKETVSIINEFFSDLRLSIEEDGVKTFILFEDICLFNDDTRAGKLFFGNLKKLIDKSKNPFLAVAVYDDEPSNIPDMYRMCMSFVTIGLPQENFRTLIIESKLGDFLSNNLNSEYLANLTDGFTYGELYDFIDSIMMSIMGKSKIIDEESFVSYFDDDVDPLYLIDKKRVELMAETIRSSRYIQKEPKLSESVFNYPSAGAVVQTVSGVLTTEQQQTNEAVTTKQEPKSFSIKDELDYSEVVNPEETENRKLPQLTL